MLKFRGFSYLELTVLYYRHDGCFACWNLWIWEPDSPGRQVDFTVQDQFGAVARITLREQSDAADLGLIPRKSAPGFPWAAKDGTRDRFIPLYYASEQGRLAVWLMQDDPRIYYREEDVDRTPKLT